MNGQLSLHMKVGMYYVQREMTPATTPAILRRVLSTGEPAKLEILTKGRSTTKKRAGTNLTMMKTFVLLGKNM